MTSETMAESAERNDKQSPWKRWWPPALISVTCLLVAPPIGLVVGPYVVDWLRNPTWTNQELLEIGVPPARLVRAENHRTGVCSGDEVFCASLTTARLKDQVQALAATLPADKARYQVTLKVEIVEEPIDLLPSILPPPRD